MEGLIADTWAQWTFTSLESFTAGAEWGEAASVDESPHFDHNVAEASPTLNHTINITGLTTANAYHVRLFARNVAGETNYTQPFILFTYDTRPDPGAPLWSVPVVSIGVTATAHVAGRRYGRRRIGALAGIAGGLGMLAVLFVGAWTAPGFRFGVDYPSDLGVAANGYLFNWGLVIAASLAIPFAWFGLRPSLPGRALPLAAAIAATSVAIAGMLVGVFTERQPELHGAVSLVTFLSLAAAGLFVVRPVMRSAHFGRVNLAFLVGLVVAIALLVAFGTGAIETAAIFLMVAWIVLTGAQILRIKEEPAAAPPSSPPASSDRP